MAYVESVNILIETSVNWTWKNLGNIFPRWLFHSAPFQL